MISSEELLVASSANAIIEKRPPLQSLMCQAKYDFQIAGAKCPEQKREGGRSREAHSSVRGEHSRVWNPVSEHQRESPTACAAEKLSSRREALSAQTVKDLPLPGRGCAQYTLSRGAGRF